MKTRTIFIVLTIVFILPAVSISQVSKKAELAISADKIIVYERYYQNGNYYAGDLKIADDENLYECPVCKGAMVLRDRKIGVANVIHCWRCEGNGYVIVKIKK